MKVTRFIIAVCMCVLLGGAFGVYAKDKNNIQNINNELLRFHIVANSDSTKDQNLKMEVRNFIFENISLNEEMDKNDVEKWFLKNKNELEEKINNFLKEKNSSYKATISIKKEYFKIKKYNNFILPAGNYDAVVVKLGEGKGKNFFCVMYPSVCVIDSVKNNVGKNTAEFEKALTKEQVKIIEQTGGKTVIKFKIIEILDKILWFFVHFFVLYVKSKKNIKNLVKNPLQISKIWYNI